MKRKFIYILICFACHCAGELQELPSDFNVTAASWIALFIFTNNYCSGFGFYRTNAVQHS